MILTVNMLIYLEVLTYWNLVKYSSVQIINLDQLSQNENEPHSFFAQVSLDLISFYRDFFVCFRKW